MYEEIMRELDAYFEKIITHRNPETEEEFIYTLEFFGMFLIGQATAEYGIPPFGIIPCNTEIDYQKVISSFDSDTLRIINSLVSLACEKFNLSRESNSDGLTFEKWFNATAEKYGLKVRYEEAIFNSKR